MKERLPYLLKQITHLEESELQQISDAFTIRQVPAKHHLTQIGHAEHNIYFVVKGVMRLYCLDAKKEQVTVFLFAENQFASSYSSFLTGLPSDQALETIEECTLLCIEKAKLMELQNNSYNINVLTRKIADQRFINAQEVFMNHIRRTPEQRYQHFESTNGDLLLRVPLNIIASFLGITSVSLSRIRNRQSKK